MDDNNSNNINNPKDIIADNIITNHQSYPANSISNSIPKTKSLNIYKDKPVPKRAKVTSGHIIAKSIITIIEKMRVNQEER